jgi:hypothetical protein
VSHGQLGELRELGPGEFAVDWRAPEHLGDVGAARIVAELQRSGREASLELPLQPGPAVRIEVVSPPLEISADGQSEIELRARVVDAFGNALPAASLSARALGNVSDFRPDEDGLLQARYRAPKSGREQVDRVRLKVEPSGPSTVVPVRLLARAGGMRLSARLGVSHNFGLVTAPLSLLRLRLRLPILGGRAFAGAQTGWFGSSSERRDRDDIEDVRTSVSAVPALSLVGYAVPLGMLELVAGVEGGVIVARTRVESELTGSDERVATHPALGGFLGAELALGPGHLVAEAAWLHARATGSASGNLAGLQLSAGYGVDL